MNKFIIQSVIRRKPSVRLCMWLVIFLAVSIIAGVLPFFRAPGIEALFADANLPASNIAISKNDAYSSSASIFDWLKLPLYVDPANDAITYYSQHPTIQGAKPIQRMGEVPTAHWVGDWTHTVRADVNTYVSAAVRARAIPILVLYNIPDRDCGLYSAGGVRDNAAYIAWIQQVAAGIGTRPVVIILEPDALASLDCLSANNQQLRYDALSQAVGILKQSATSHVYLDAGNPAWQTVSTMALRLKAANIAQADGFSLNVSNFVSTSRNQRYGNQLSMVLAYKHYIIDTSRNGNDGASDGKWCNPKGRALGSEPTTVTGDVMNDELLWIKIPWESDGSCHNAPAAGHDFWPYARMLARNARWK